MKDLERVGRDLSRTIIIDNVAQNFTRQPENGIHIRSWFDDVNDTALIELAPILIKIVEDGYVDVRDGMRELIGC